MKIPRKSINENKKERSISSSSKRDFSKCIDCVVKWAKDSGNLPNCANCEEFNVSEKKDDILIK